MDLRGHRRIHVFLPASIETDSGAVEVKLKNMSCGGALIETDKALAAGSTLLFRRGLLEMLSTVVWTSGNRAGLSFETELDEGNLFVVTRRLPASPSRPWIG